MSEDLYERYKATLRAGHVALLRGSLDEAAVEYRKAAEIAPARALPHTSLGGVYMRLGHLQEALTEYAEAVSLAPADEGALLGLAEALSVAGQRVDAASTLDSVAGVQEASGRLPEAADTLRRALELEDSVERVQRHRTLLRQIRLSEGDQAAEQLLARALRLREEPSPASPTRSRRTRTDDLVAELARLSAAPAEPAEEPATEPVEIAAAWPVENDSGGPQATATAPSAGPIDSAETSVIVDLAEPADATAVAEPGAAIEELLSIDATTLEEALALRMEALSGDLALGVAAIGAEPATEPEAVHAAGPEAAESELVPEPNLALEVEPGARPEPGAESEPALAAERAAEAMALVRPEPRAASDAITASEFDGEPEASEPAEPEPVPAGSTAESESFALPDEVEPPVVAVMEEAHAATTRGRAEVQLQPTGDELLAAAEAAEASGDLKNLRSLLVWTARAYAREGRFEAALDAAHQLLQRYPGDVDAHLVLVELYVARDWDVLAVEKLGLLDRLARLGEDQATHDRLRAVAVRAFPGDPRVDGILGDQGTAAPGA